jgi:DNA-binding NtrC family response regulator
VKDTQSTNLSLMQSLSITRDQKQKSKKVIESTPSRFVTALESLVRNTSGEQLRRINTEMAEAARRLQLNLSTLRELVPSDVVAVEGTEGDADGDDIV